jgi:hypothetical protein
MPSQLAVVAQEVSSPVPETPTPFGKSPEIFRTAPATSTHKVFATDAQEMSFAVSDLFGDSPDALATPRATPIEPAVTGSFGLVADASEMSITAPPEPAFKGAHGLARLWGWEMLVRDTFLEVVSSSPRGRTVTTPLSGNTEPKDFAPQIFKLEEPAVVNESPVVISLKELLTPAVAGHDGTGAIPIMLNLNVWIPPSASRASGATELPQRLRLSEEHFPRPRALPEASPPGGESVCRCLF